MEDGDTHVYAFYLSCVNQDDRAVTFQVFPMRQVRMTFTMAFSFQKV
jgi:hypothetical protein